MSKKAIFGGVIMLLLFVIMGLLGNVTKYTYMLEQLFIFNASVYMFALIVHAPLVFFVVYRFMFKRSLRAGVFIAVCICSFLLSMGSGYISKMEDEYRVDQYDIDRDGLFSEEEAAMPGFEDAEDTLYNDTWFSLLPITSAVFAVIITSVSFFCVAILPRRKE
jgi:hypothetical protein